MVAGAQAVSVGAAVAEIDAALRPLSHRERVEALMAVLAGLGRDSGQPRLFCALVRESLSQRLGNCE